MAAATLNLILSRSSDKSHSCHRSAKQYAMCPLVDFINHSSTVESEVSYDYVYDCFSVTASRDYQQGDQVCDDTSGGCTSCQLRLPES